MRWLQKMGVAVLAPVAMASCATTGSSDVLNYVANNNRMLRNLDQNISPSVTKLNQSVADLIVRLDANEQATRTANSNMEAVQVQLQAMQQQLDDVQRVIYRQHNLSVPSSRTAATPTAPGSTPGVQVGPITQEPDLDSLSAPLGGSPVPPSAQGLDADLMGAPEPSVAPPAPVAEATPPPPPAEPESPPVASGGDLYEQATESFRAANYEQALAQYDAYLRQNPGTDDRAANAQFWKGEALLKLGRPQDAVVEFEQLRSKYPSSQKVPYALHQEADALLKLGENEEAVKLLRELIQDYPMTKPAQNAKQELERRNLM